MGSASSSVNPEGGDVIDGRVTGTDNEVRDNISDSEREAILSIDYAEYEYPFENLVFEGGGAKGAVYIGCMEVLSDVGIKPKRVAGASAGAICATLVALGYKPGGPDEAGSMYSLFQEDMTRMLKDAPLGICSLLPNLINKFGWHAADGFKHWFGKIIAEKMDGDPDATFMQVYRKHKVELCVTAVNVNMLSVEYFHPKTSPDMKVRDAVRMSVAIPGVFQPVEYNKNKKKNRNEDKEVKDLYVDGGTLCNYPLHAFDGWWLSMNPEDTLLNKLKLDQVTQLMENRFDGVNQKTVGFLVYSGDEREIMQLELNSRVGLEVARRPENSDIYKIHLYFRQWMKDRDEKKRIQVKNQEFIEAFDTFFKILVPLNREQEDGQGVIDKAELIEAIKMALANEAAARPEHRVTTSEDPENEHEMTQALPAHFYGNGDVSHLVSHTAEEPHFGHDMLRRLFGDDGADPEKVFDELDLDENGKITFIELKNYIEKECGISIQGYRRKDIPTVGAFFGGIVDCFTSHAKKVYIQDGDVERSVGINTDYVGTLDFGLTDDDRDFCVEQGRRATIAFLRHYVHKNKATMKKRNVVSTQPLSKSRHAALLTSQPSPFRPGVMDVLPHVPPIPPHRLTPINANKEG